MIVRFFRKDQSESALYALYRAVVAAARRPFFFAQWGVPDTVTGRFDVLSLHMALVLRRLKGGDAEAKAFAQQLFDLFFKDMDRSLRELGVSDVTIGKRVRKLSEVFFGLLAGLEPPLAAGDRTGLAIFLARNGIVADPESGRDLANYLIGESDRLAAVPHATLLTGQLNKEEVSA